jgi:hypothetical protein
VSDNIYTRNGEVRINTGHIEGMLRPVTRLLGSIVEQTAEESGVTRSHNEPQIAADAVVLGAGMLLEALHETGQLPEELDTKAVNERLELIKKEIIVQAFQERIGGN